jgi:hypothetical protein
MNCFRLKVVTLFVCLSCVSGISNANGVGACETKVPKLVEHNLAGVNPGQGQDEKSATMQRNLIIVMAKQLCEKAEKARGNEKAIAQVRAKFKDMINGSGTAESKMTQNMMLQAFEIGLKG